MNSCTPDAVPARKHLERARRMGRAAFRNGT